MRAGGGFGSDHDLGLLRAGSGQGSARASSASIPTTTSRASPDLRRVIKAQGRVAALQLHHAGYRSPRNVAFPRPSDLPTIPRPVRAVCRSPRSNSWSQDFIGGARSGRAGRFRRRRAARRARLHPYPVPVDHRQPPRRPLWRRPGKPRADRPGDHRRRARAACRPDFQLGLRLSPERYGLRLAEMRDLATEIMAAGKIDYLDMSLWDARKEPVEAAFAGRSLASWFTDLPRGQTPPRRRRQDHDAARGRRNARARGGLRAHRPRRHSSPRLSATRAGGSRLRAGLPAGHRRLPCRQGLGRALPPVHGHLGRLRRRRPRLRPETIRPGGRCARCGPPARRDRNRPRAGRPARSARPGR